MRTPVVALLLVVLPAATNVPAQGVGAPIHIPGPGDGYNIIPDESSQMAPSGYEGRTDRSIQTAIGNTPGTAGKRVVARFTFANKVKTCPRADGTAEGDGELSFSIERTETQLNGTRNVVSIEGRAIAHYKGQVSDDGFLHDEVQAEIDYTYTQVGTIRDQNGAILPPANATQHVTIGFRVRGPMTPPTLGTFAGGDPTIGHYSEAFSVGTALTYWAGVWYGTAMARWQSPGTCVKVVFDPPSNTVAVVPGARTRVDAEVKTKSGESVKARFFDASPSRLAGVAPQEGPSDVGSPMRFVFTAPAQRVTSAGFSVKATSRAGAANGEWKAGLGTGWSGRITYSRETSDQGENEMQKWSSSVTTRLTVDLTNGAGTASGYTEVHDTKLSRQKALRNQVLTLITASSSTSDGIVQDDAPATVEVTSLFAGTYKIRVSFAFTRPGNSRVQMCGRDSKCTESDQPLLITVGSPAMDGTVDDPNHLRGSKSNVTTGLGYRGDGKSAWTVTWDLARQGSAQ